MQLDNSARDGTRLLYSGNRSTWLRCMKLHSTRLRRSQLAKQACKQCKSSSTQRSRCVCPGCLRFSLRAGLHPVFKYMEEDRRGS